MGNFFNNFRKRQKGEHGRCILNNYVIKRGSILSMPIQKNTELSLSQIHAREMNFICWGQSMTWIAFTYATNANRGSEGHNTTIYTDGSTDLTSSTSGWYDHNKTEWRQFKPREWFSGTRRLVKRKWTRSLKHIWKHRRKHTSKEQVLEALRIVTAGGNFCGQDCGYCDMQRRNENPYKGHRVRHRCILLQSHPNTNTHCCIICSYQIQHQAACARQRERHAMDWENDYAIRIEWEERQTEATHKRRRERLSMAEEDNYESRAKSLW